MDSHLQSGDYTDSKADNWANKICEDCIQQLTSLKKPFKFIGKLFLFLVFVFLFDNEML